MAINSLRGRLAVNLSSILLPLERYTEYLHRDARSRSSARCNTDIILLMHDDKMLIKDY